MKRIACLLACLLGLCLFAGCGGTENTPETPEQPDASLGENFDAVDTTDLEKVVTAPTFSVPEDAREDETLFTPNSLFGDNMILQRNAVTCIWGSTMADEVAVRIDGATYYGTVENGTFTVYLAPHAAGSGYTLELLSTQGKRTVGNVCFGEVFLLSGQSNMAWSMAMNANGDFGVHSGAYKPSETEPTYSQFAGDSAERNAAIAARVAEKLAACTYPDIRLYNVPVRAAEDPVYAENQKQTDAGGTWTPCTPETMAAFSAVGCWFGTTLHELTDIPVGLICAALGSTNIPTWMSEETYEENRDVCMYGGDRTQDEFNRAARCYNQYIYPLLGYKCKAAVWYQGEGQPLSYGDSLKALIGGWRVDFGYELPFLIVGLPRYGENDEVPAGYAATDAGEGTLSASPFAIREEQKRAEDLPAVYRTVNVDAGDYDELHPADKDTVGIRLVWKVMDAFYGAEGNWSSPELLSAARSENGVLLTFRNAAGGMVVENNSRNLEAAGADGVYYPARAASVGDNGVEVTCSAVEEIVSVRYGYLNYPKLDRNDVRLYMSLFNGAGLPADQFVVTIEG